MVNVVVSDEERLQHSEGVSQADPPGGRISEEDLGGKLEFPEESGKGSRCQSWGGRVWGAAMRCQRDETRGG